MWIYIVLLSIIFNCVAAIEFTVLNSTITDVEIGGTTAEISRSFAVQDVPTGFHSIVVNDMPKTVDEKSVEVSGMGSAQIISTELQVAQISRDTEQDYQQLIRQLDTVLANLNTRRTILNDEKNLIVARKSAVDAYVQDSVRNEPRHNNTPPLTPDKLLDLLDLRQQETQAAVALVSALDVKIKQLGDLVNYVTSTAAHMQTTGYYRNWFSATGFDWDAVPTEVVESLHALPNGDRFWVPSSESRKLVINIYVPFQAELAGA